MITYKLILCTVNFFMINNSKFKNKKVKHISKICTDNLKKQMKILKKQNK